MKDDIIKNLLMIMEEMTNPDGPIVLKECVDSIIDSLVVIEFEFENIPKAKRKDKYRIITDIVDLLTSLYEGVEIENTNILNVLIELNDFYDFKIDFNNIEDIVYKVIICENDTIFVVPSRRDEELIESLEKMKETDVPFKEILPDILNLIKNTKNDFKNKESFAFVKHENGKDRVLRKYIGTKKHENKINKILKGDK